MMRRMRMMKRMRMMRMSKNAKSLDLLFFFSVSSSLPTPQNNGEMYELGCLKIDEPSNEFRSYPLGFL